MRVSDTALVVSAMIHVAEQNGTGNVTPGKVTSFIHDQFQVTLPLHQVVDILRDLNIITHRVGNSRCIVWEEKRMENLKTTFTSSVNAITNNYGNLRGTP